MGVEGRFVGFLEGFLVGFLEGFREGFLEGLGDGLYIEQKNTLVMYVWAKNN